jgi:uncharacterized protein with PIN domain
MFKPLLIAGLLATAGLTAFSQAPVKAMSDCMGYERMDHMERMNPARMQAWMDKRHAALKAKLKLSAAQEADWTTYLVAMKPPMGMMDKKAQHDELAKLSTPERIDKMKALRSQHMTEMNTAMDKQGEASKTFYATLTPEQKKAYDEAAVAHYAGKGAMHGDKGHMNGMNPAKGPASAPAKP